ncbi:hypothetical protein [Haloarcula montana]|uniref:hypothetical protein n=1 Tax=Haloarcula montana TaxID=3111776 RepID=UPI002D774BAB|nr:hypothetical protein [Haloarcula sp. GH36]
MGTEHVSPTGGTPSPDPDDGVYPAVVRTRSDGNERYICYTDAADVESKWLSVDADVPVSVLLWR